MSSEDELRGKDASWPWPFYAMQSEEIQRVVKDFARIDPQARVYPSVPMIGETPGANGLTTGHGRSSMKITARMMTEAPSETSPTELPNHARLPIVAISLWGAAPATPTPCFPSRRT